MKIYASLGVENQVVRVGACGVIPWLDMIVYIANPYFPAQHLTVVHPFTD